MILSDLNVPSSNGALSASAKVYISGVSEEMAPVQRLISEIAPTDIPVLLVGESGTGKEMAAMQIHVLSHYRELRFLKMACSTVAAEALDSHFTSSGNGGSEKNCHLTGTLFLDEVGELDQDRQRHLLHAIPDGANISAGQVMGGRIVSCSSRDLETDVHHGKFRSDLFYRLSGVCVQLPPLRRRRDDIPVLVGYFLKKYARVFSRSEMTLSDRAMQLIVEHPWPGNIRQLENVIKRIVALENEDLGIVDLKISPMFPTLSHTSVAEPTRSLKAASRAASRQAERELILQTLERTHWNRKRAAEALQISYKSLLFKLKQIQVPESEGV
ncbi:MAG: two component, sigma54 specific, transcriptional regulator, Fis family [Candidatus Acidoferrum typicum]|nr:two component, sigma54 specific, transcriptional regulator, Fis family [Candidatus Acidoferrum typicum]